MNTDAMVEAPIEERGCAGGDRVDPSASTGRDGRETANGRLASGMDDRNRSGADHGGVSMPDCSARSDGST